MLEHPPVELRRLLDVPTLAHHYGPITVRVTDRDGVVDEIRPDRHAVGETEVSEG